MADRLNRLVRSAQLALGNGARDSVLPAAGRLGNEFDNDPDYRGGAFGDSPAKVCAPED
ncbi:hypothetical protein GCM10010522_23690 [Kribbella solani]